MGVLLNANINLPNIPVCILETLSVLDDCWFSSDISLKSSNAFFLAASRDMPAFT